MVKYFCDRCGKEAKSLTEIKIPIKKLDFEDFEAKTIRVCCGCRKEYKDIINKLIDIRFILFSTFMTNK